MNTNNIRMVEYAILMIQKLNNHAAMAKRIAHAAREGKEYPVNADPAKAKQNIVLVSPHGDINSACIITKTDECNKMSVADIMFQRIKMLVKNKIRINAVLLIEEVVSVSREKWNAMKNEEGECEKWIKWASEEQKKCYGEKLLYSVFHGDESAGHIHAFIIPLDAKGHLNARKMLTKVFMSKRQTSHANAVQTIGLARGTTRSKATHVELEAFHEMINEPKENITVTEVDFAILKDIYNKKSLDEYISCICEVANQRIKYARSVMYAKAVAYDCVVKQNEELRELLYEKEQIALKYYEYEAKIKEYEKLMDVEREKRDKAKNALKYMLEVIYGPAKVTFESDNKYDINGRSVELIGDAVHYTVHNIAKSTKSPFVFLRDIFNIQFTEALGIIKQSMSEEVALELYKSLVEQNINNAPKTSFWENYSYHILRKDNEEWPMVKKLYSDICCVPDRVIQDLSINSSIYATDKGNCVIPVRDENSVVVGAYVSGLKGNAYECVGIVDHAVYAIGSPVANRIIVTNSPHHAIQAHTLDPEAQVVSIMYPEYNRNAALFRRLRKLKRCVVAFKDDDDLSCLNDMIKSASIDIENASKVHIAVEELCLINYQYPDKTSKLNQGKRRGE